MHHDPVAPDLIQIELDHGGSLGRLRVGGLDRPENFALGAKQDDAPTPAHALGELGRGVFHGAAAGWHGLKGCGWRESNQCGPKWSWWLDNSRAPSRGVVTEIALHYDPLIVRYLFVPDPIARLLAARLR